MGQGSVNIHPIRIGAMHIIYSNVHVIDTYKLHNKGYNSMFRKLMAWFRKDSRVVVRNGQSLIDQSKFYSIKAKNYNMKIYLRYTIMKLQNI